MTAAHTASIMDAGDAELARLRERVKVLEAVIYDIRLLTGRITGNDGTAQLATIIHRACSAALTS